MSNRKQDNLVTERDIVAYERDGAVCLRSVFDAHWLEELAAGLDRNFADPGPDNTVYTQEGESGSFYDDYCNWQRIPEYRDFVLNSPAGEIAGRITRSAKARIYHEHVLVKEPGTQRITPWHHDLTYYGVNGNQLCSIWLPLDPVPLRVCPEFVAGSHLGGTLYYPRLFVNHQNYAEGAQGFDAVPDIDGHRDDYHILSWELNPGDCIVFHMRTLHGAPATVGVTTRRRGFSTRWLGDDAHFAVRPWKTSPPYREVDLKPGDPMEHTSFPVVWSA